MGERMFAFFQAIVAAFWAPITNLFFIFFPDPGIEVGDTPEQEEQKLFRARWSGRIRRTLIVVLGFLLLSVGFVLKTGGVACAEWLDFTTVGRIAIVLGGIASLLVTPVVALAVAVLVLWIIIAIGLIQIPIGEAMEVLRELGQHLRVQDPKVRDGEGNIRLVNVQKLLRWSMLLLMIPALDLMSTVWLAVFPNWYVYAMLLLISGGGLVFGMIAAARGRKVGGGLDLLLGMNGYLVVGGIITLLASMWIHLQYPHAAAVAAHGASALTGTGLPWDSDWQLASYLAEVANHGGFVGVDITAYPGAFGAVLGIGFVGLLVLVLHVATIVALWRILRKPPEHEQTTASDPDVVVVGTAGRGNSGFSGLSMNGWFQSAIGFGLLAAIVWLVNRYGAGEYTCRFGDPFFTFVLALVVVGIVAGLLKQIWPRAASALGVLALVCVLFGFTYDALEHWGGRQTACAVDEPPAAPTATVPARRTYEPAPPPRRSGPYEPRPSGDGRIATYFAANGAQCPDAARRSGWESLRDAQASCRSESWLARNADWR